MMILIIGQAASGKSAYAESVAVALGGGLCYLATMAAQDAESRRRIEKHRHMRAGKDFFTLELPIGIGRACPAVLGKTVLVECLSNLVANEMYLPGGAGRQAGARIMQDILALRSGCRNLILVGNDVFCDGVKYEEGTMEYMEILGNLQCATAACADVVAEVVCGLPLFHKGKEIASKWIF